MTKRLARAYCLLAGACDLATGALLISAPSFALGLMRVEDPVTEPIWMRFVGAFVLGIGLLYWYGLLREPRGGARLAHLMEATAVIRTCVATFTGVAIATGALSIAWLSVCLSDATFAIAQVALLNRGGFDRES